MKTSRNKLLDSINLIWTIAAKDILASLRNKLMLSLVLGMGFMLLMPKLLGLMLVPPEIRVLVYDPEESRLTAELEASDQYQVQRARSITEMKQVIGTMGFGLGAKFGLAMPDDFDQILDSTVMWPGPIE